ncbi:hypothetical protein [Flavobacterium suzhouense]|uniref:Cell wall anchor protein n=1 Tax=Flavobacterium suzhouense TaxID=1529638 RepID=A0ABW5NWY8_9FLAO
MKKQLFTLSFALCAAFGYSQFQSPNSSAWPTTGKVGLGTTSPAYKLQVLTNETLAPISTYSETIASIGYFANSSLFFDAQGTVAGRVSPTEYHTMKIQMKDVGNKVGYIEFNGQPTTNTTKAAMSFGTNSVEAMRINQNGKVRIGSSDRATPDGYKLFVEQGILTEKVKVAVSTTADWADYVFASDYKLMPLEEVEKFTKENNHLPNVPSAADMVNNGLDVAKMDAKLLEKIEELTLYAVQQNKENKDLKAELENQKREIEELKGMLKDLLTKK